MRILNRRGNGPLMVNAYYLISYDLKDASPKEYDAVNRAIKNINGIVDEVHVLNTVWIVYFQRSTTVRQIKNALQKCMNDDDKLIVIRLGHRITPFNFETYGDALVTMRTIIKGLKQND